MSGRFVLSITWVVLEREFYLPDPQALPRGLDVLEVRADVPGKQPLALLAHETSAQPEDRATVTPWAFLGQAPWIAERGYVALVVVRRGENDHRALFPA